MNFERGGRSCLPPTPYGSSVWHYASMSIALFLVLSRKYLNARNGGASATLDAAHHNPQATVHPVSIVYKPLTGIARHRAL